VEHLPAGGSQFSPGSTMSWGQFPCSLYHPAATCCPPRNFLSVPEDPIASSIRNSSCTATDVISTGFVLLYHDNARSYTTLATQERIQELQWELLEHLPYSLDLAPGDFHLFGPLKNHLVANVSLIVKRLKWRC
jgi:hypothetical protein